MATHGSSLVVSRQVTKLEPSWPGGPGAHAVKELVSTTIGAHSPFGDDVRFPLPLAALRYEPSTARPTR